LLFTLFCSERFFKNFQKNLQYFNQEILQNIFITFTFQPAAFIFLSAAQNVMLRNDSTEKLKSLDMAGDKLRLDSVSTRHRLCLDADCEWLGLGDLMNSPVATRSFGGLSPPNKAPSLPKSKHETL